MATQILALNGEGNAEHYDGDYTEFHDWKAARLSERSASADGLRQGKLSANSAIAQGTAGLENESNRAGKSAPHMRSVPSAQVSKSGKRQRGKTEEPSPRVKVIKKARSPEVIEAEIAELEKRLANLSDEMSKPEIARDITQLVKVNDDYEASEARLRELLEEWERAAV